MLERDESFQRGLERSRNGDHHGAEREFTHAIESGYEEPTVYLLRALSRFRLEQWAGAEADATLALQQLPYTGTYALRGASRLKQKRYIHAASDLIIAAYTWLREKLF